jgi:hypothetical protein
MQINVIKYDRSNQSALIEERVKTLLHPLVHFFPRSCCPNHSSIPLAHVKHGGRQTDSPKTPTNPQRRHRSKSHHHPARGRRTRPIQKTTNRKVPVHSCGRYLFPHSQEEEEGGRAPVIVLDLACGAIAATDRNLSPFVSIFRGACSIRNEGRVAVVCRLPPCVLSPVFCDTSATLL